MSNLQDDDNKILKILGLTREELIGIIVALAAVIFTIVYFRGCTTDPTNFVETLSTDISQSQPVNDESNSEIVETEVTNIRVAYRPNYVHFDGTGADSESVEIFINGEPAGQTATTFMGSWSYEVQDLEPGLYDIYVQHDDPNSRSVTRVFAIDQNLAGDVTVEILLEGSQLADIRDETAAKLPDSSAAELTTPLIDSVTEGVAVTAGAIALSGTGSPNVEHQLFVNGELIDSTKSDAEGRWS
ncbi:MAG: hypothetical protein AAGD96_06075, partial [Chloroflexota bacterium]